MALLLQHFKNAVERFDGLPASFFVGKGTPICQAHDQIVLQRGPLLVWIGRLGRGTLSLLLPLLFFELLQDATQFIPPAIHARASRVALRLGAANAMRPVLNLVISNVPGPRTPLFCAGAKLLANYPVSVISDGAGLNMTCMSYRDGVDFGIVADREQAGDAGPILAAVRDALDELDATVCGGGRRPARRTPQPLP